MIEKDRVVSSTPKKQDRCPAGKGSQKGSPLAKQVEANRGNHLRRWIEGTQFDGHSMLRKKEKPQPEQFQEPRDRKQFRGREVCRERKENFSLIEVERNCVVLVTIVVIHTVECMCVKRNIGIISVCVDECVAVFGVVICCM